MGLAIEMSQPHAKQWDLIHFDISSFINIAIYRLYLFNDILYHR